MNLNEFYQNYIDQYVTGMNNISLNHLEKFINKIKDCVAVNGTIYVCGNGGSAAISDHLVCDTLKGIRSSNGMSPKVVSLVSNVPLITAIANDISYDEVFAYQLESYLDINSQSDILIIVSSSGNSPNVIRALETAKGMGVYTIAMVGFSGGKAAEIADIVLHVPINNYGVVEDSHQSLMHIISQFLSR